MGIVLDDSRDATWLQHPPHLSQGARRLAQVRDEGMREQRVETAAGIGQCIDIALIEPNIANVLRSG